MGAWTPQLVALALALGVVALAIPAGGVVVRRPAPRPPPRPLGFTSPDLLLPPPRSQP